MAGHNILVNENTERRDIKDLRKEIQRFNNSRQREKINKASKGQKQQEHDVEDS